MTRPAVKGWCPGAHRPMASGDGLIVRVRPPLARLTAGQALRLCEAADALGSGTIELTSRANLQMRGVRDDGHAALLERLAALDLLDADSDVEARRNVLVAPLWGVGDDTSRIASELTRRLDEFPELPGKFGFAVDCGATLQLAGCSGDIRIERGGSGGLILRADGAAMGQMVAPDDAVGAALELARWFVESGGAASGRMARHLAVCDLPGGTEAPAKAAPKLRPGATRLGPVVGAAFGQTTAADLAALVRASGATAVRLTPWRLIVLEGGASDVSAPGFVTAPSDPALTAHACPGLPSCASASVATRELARALAGRVAGRLHVSGCAKGCAHAGSSDVTLIGRDGRFDVIYNGDVRKFPAEFGISGAALRARYGSV